MIRPLVLWLLRLALGALYLFAAVPKILDPSSFAGAIHNFRIVPTAVIPSLAVWLPVFEGMAACAVLLGFFFRGGVLALSVLSAAFAGGIASAILRGLDIDCGCFGGAAHSRANFGHLFLNLAALAAGIILLAARERRQRRRLRRA